MYIYIYTYHCTIFGAKTLIKTSIQIGTFLRVGLEVFVIHTTKPENAFCYHTLTMVRQTVNDLERNL